MVAVPAARLTPLVLASSSSYRRALLARLCLPFEWRAPDVDERALPGEAPAALARRLAEHKAAVVGRGFRRALVIGSDQVAVNDGRTLGKPGHREAAIAQLAAASGRAVTFHTAVCVLDVESGRRRAAVVPCTVHFRPLGMAEICAYVDAEEPFDCAGSFKAEGLGIVLFERFEGEDPTALTGLPLIALARLLRESGCDVLGSLPADP